MASANGLGRCVATRADRGSSQPYDALGLVVPQTGPVGGLVCSQFVYECLPASLRRRVPPWPARRPVAPNDLAQAFGATTNNGDMTL